MDKILDLMNRMGEPITSSNYWEVRMKETPIVLQEGLITTYHPNTTLNAICKSFNLRQNGENKQYSLPQIMGEKTSYIGDAYLIKNKYSDDTIKISLDFNEDIITHIEKRMNKYGWSLYRIDKNIEGRNEYYFEKLFPHSFLTKHLQPYFDFIYHVAPINIKDKILKQGLIPKESKTPGYKNEPRVYFSTNFNDALDWDIETQRNNVIFKIDLNKLNPEHKFYIDARMVDTLFSKEPIPPTAIEIIEN